MLPSFRLIAATFVCGFLIVFAGLRLAASLHDIHEAGPVMAAHAAPAAIASAADREPRRGLAPPPLMFDLRFAVSTVSPTLVRVAPTVLDHMTGPFGQLMSLLPPEADVSADDKPAPEALPENAMAAIQPQEPAAEAPDTVSDASAELPKPQTPVLAAIDTRADWRNDGQTGDTDRPVSEIPAPAARTAAIEPQTSALPESAEPLLAESQSAEPQRIEGDAAAVETAPNLAAELPAVSGDAPNSRVKVKMPKPHPITSAAPRVKAKAAIAPKKRIRTARRITPPAAPNAFGSFNSSSANQFGVQ